MAINKNFVIKNGLEVDTNLILADSQTNKVGIGITAPQYTLHVNGGIGVTNSFVSGIGTIVTLQSTIGTITNLTATDLFSGVGTIGRIQSTDINNSGVTTSTTLNITGTGTIAVGVVTFLSGTNLNYSGIATIGTLGVTGISTFSSVNTGNINIAGIVTGLNVSGVSTLGTVNISSGIITARSGVVTYFGDGSYLTGTASYPPLQSVLNIGNNSTIGMSIVGVVTVTSLNATNLNVTGIATAQDFDALSDENYKKNVITVNNALNKVEQLRGVSFDWKENGRSSYGVIAQELQKVLPELVHGDNPKTVNYNGIIGVLIEAIKELKKEIEELKCINKKE